MDAPASTFRPGSGTGPGDRRRATADRRAGAQPGRRGGPRLTDRAAQIGRQVMLALLLVAVIAVAAVHTQRIFSGRARVGERLLARGGPAPLILPETALVVPPELAASPAFQRDRERFVSDLLRTGRMSPARADSVATFVVREAYLRGVSPALVFGVMIAENAQFVSDTASNVGAVGLMQIYGKVWLKELGERFGTNLADDETNVRYGVFILSEYFKPRRGESTASAWNRGLLRYNGCVRGRNTPNCKTYPNKVRRHVEREAVALCAGKSYYDCIARPMIEGLTGKGVLD